MSTKSSKYFYNHPQQFQARIEELEARPEKEVAFRHPGYVDRDDAFLIIFVHDFEPEGTDVGIERQMAELCCSIVAGNRFGDSFLTEQRLSISDRITDTIR